MVLYIHGRTNASVVMRDYNSLLISVERKPVSYVAYVG